MKASAENGGTGRSSSVLATKLRRVIQSGKVSAGDLLPSVRALSDEHKVAPKTVLRALKALAAEGLVMAEPRQGYRVLARAYDPHQGHPVAFVLGMTGHFPEALDNPHHRIWNAVHGVVTTRSWSLLGLTSGGREPGEVLNQIRTAKAWGTLVDCTDRTVLAEFAEARIPVVMVDAWVEDSPFDSVLQDNYQGAFIAAQHLLGKGHERIAWFGSLSASAHSRERFGGACAALGAVGQDIPRDLRYDMDTHSDFKALAKEMLSKKDRPTAVLALWHGVSVGVAEAAQELGLQVGRDFDMVGWATDQMHGDFVKAFPEGMAPPAIVWTIQDMAEMAVGRLVARREHPEWAPVRINVPARLVTGG